MKLNRMSIKRDQHDFDISRNFKEGRKKGRKDHFFKNSNGIHLLAVSPTMYAIKR